MIRTFFTFLFYRDPTNIYGETRAEESFRLGQYRILEERVKDAMRSAKESILKPSSQDPEVEKAISYYCEEFRFAVEICREREDFSCITCLSIARDDSLPRQSDLDYYSRREARREERGLPAIYNQRELQRAQDSFQRMIHQTNRLMSKAQQEINQINRGIHVKWRQ